MIVNLLIDGYTNNAEEHIFREHNVSSFQMMTYLNYWQAFFLACYLVATYVLYGESGELAVALEALQSSTVLRYDIFFFCASASIGQLLVFALIHDLGALTWICISVTRKIFTILLSVFMFGHSIKPFQWIGVVLVFIGMSIDVYYSHVTGESNNHHSKTKQH